MLSRLKLIAEPWDVGPGGYQLGSFPPGFAEWNDRFRDNARRFWRGDNGQRAALSAASVTLEVEGMAPVAMQREADGFVSAGLGCAAGSRYRYRLPDGRAVPDPAARAQAETVLYELHPGLLGGFRGVMAQLPCLQALGVTAVELMPVACCPGRWNWGYDGVLPFAPDPSLGSPEELKALVDAARGLGLMMFLDVVYNHFGPDGNYLHAYVAPFFRADATTPWGEAIAFDQPAVRGFFLHNALYWLNEYRFDGLRLDAVHAIAPRSALAAAPGSDAHLFYAQWNDDWHHCPHRLRTGETGGYYADYADPAEKLARCLAEGLVDGVRVDHSDRLADPADYLRRLRRRLANAPAGPAFVWAEKSSPPVRHSPPSGLRMAPPAMISWTRSGRCCMIRRVPRISRAPGSVCASGGRFRRRGAGGAPAGSARNPARRDGNGSPRPP